MPQICPICSKLRRSNQSAIECTNCLKWVHHKNKTNCSGLTDKEFSVHLNEEYKIWLCDNCVHSKNFEILTHLPFFGLPDDYFVTGNPPINSNASNSVATRYKEFLSQCSQFETSIVQFNGDDHTDDVYSTVNSKYYDIDEFNSLKIDTHSSFSVCHVNIASLDKHIDDLRSIISQLSHRFDVIGISEHKVMRDSVPANNVSLTGYEEFIFPPLVPLMAGLGFLLNRMLII